MMARNKHPEETVNKILDVSLDLFFRKGFDRTSIQDIIDNLGGLTKGAVYHHFKSKEDILSAALDRDNERLYKELTALRDEATMTGAQKFQALLEASITGPQFEIWEKVAPSTDPLQNSRLLGLEYQAIFTETVPLFVEPIVRQGMADGSIQTENPRELSEVLVLLANLWAGPMFRESTQEELKTRILYYIQIAEKLGIKLSDNGSLDILETHRRAHSEYAKSFDASTAAESTPGNGKDGHSASGRTDRRDDLGDVGSNPDRRDGLGDVGSNPDGRDGLPGDRGVVRNNQEGGTMNG